MIHSPPLIPFGNCDKLLHCGAIRWLAFRKRIDKAREHVKSDPGFIFYHLLASWAFSLPAQLAVLLCLSKSGRCGHFSFAPKRTSRQPPSPTGYCSRQYKTKHGFFGANAIIGRDAL